MAVSDGSLKVAIQNIAQYGDTDVFPYPLENHWFHDEPDCVLSLLRSLDKEFDPWLAKYPVTFAKILSGVGYAGFRAATQIDPIWNAYLLALTIEIGHDLEAARVDIARGVVFSYRLHREQDDSGLFDRTLGWAQFHQRALDLAKSSDVVTTTDISDFYPRIYHHRLKNALDKASRNSEVIRRIMELLKRLSGGTSYGLPVGGNAARICADLLLNRVDRLLLSQRVKFCRFVDDYIIFADSRQEAHSNLVFLAESLLDNEGLALSKAKTRFLTQAEFLRFSPFAEPTTAESADEAESRAFLRLRLRFDPYSPTAEQDYSELAADIDKFDIRTMLARELGKSRIDEVLIRQLIKALRYMPPERRDKAIASLIDSLDILYPVFSTVAIVLKGILGDLADTARDDLFATLRRLIQTNSHITLVPTNLAYAVRLLSRDRSDEADAILIDLYNRPRSNMLIKREIILAMAARGADYWLSDLLKRFTTLTHWEQRALVVASYTLGDEGSHWRNATIKELPDVDQQFARWIGTKNSGRTWELPL